MGTQFSYDEFGKITSVSDAAGTREFTYNTFGELETETCGNAAISELRDNFGRSLGYVYSKSGTAQQTTSVGYDSASGRIASAGFLHGGNVKNFTYNYLAGTRLLAQLVCPNHMTQNLTYEATSDLIIGMKFKRGATDVVIRNYAYDNLARPISRSTARQGSVQNDTFAYNSRSELVAGTLGGNAFNFAFDEIGNQTQFACNATNETTIEGDFVPAYDADGNATLIKTATGTWSVSYNAENRPVRFECVGTQTVVEMNYDYLGRRFEKKITVAGTTTLHHRYIYRGFLQIACLDLTRAGTPALWFVFWDPTQPTATRPLAIQKNGTWFVYGHDLTKNVCEVFGSDGYIKTTYSYSPFGNVSSVGNFEQNFQWSSEFYDPELGLVYYNYRHYSPTTARWLSRDPIEERGGLNLYAFCKNNLILKFDLLGENLGDFGNDDQFSYLEYVDNHRVLKCLCNTIMIDQVSIYSMLKNSQQASSMLLVTIEKIENFQGDFVGFETGFCRETENKTTSFKTGGEMSVPKENLVFLNLHYQKTFENGGRLDIRISGSIPHSNLEDMREYISLKCAYQIKF